MMKHIVESSDGIGITDLAVTRDDIAAAQVYADFHCEDATWKVDCHEALAREFAKHRVSTAKSLAREAFDAGFACGSSVEGWTSEQAWAVSKIKRRLDNGDQQ